MKGIVYARVSTPGQAERETPIESQISKCMQYAREKGIEVIATFVDEGISGTTDERPNFKKAVDFAVQEKVDAFIVFDTSRFARDRATAVYYKRLLRKHGVQIHYVVAPLPDDPLASVLMEGVSELLDEYYVHIIREHTLRGIEESIRKRIYPKNKCPVGYRIVRGEDGKPRIYKDEESGKVYFRILQLFKSGVGAKEIARALNRELATDEWNKKKVLRVLKNPLYKGVLKYNRVEVYFEDLRYISDNEWEEVQKLLKERTQEKGQGKSQLLFLGLLKCGRCGASMTTMRGKGRGGMYHYYTCVRRRDYGDCKQENLRADHVDSFLLKEVTDYILTEENLRAVADKLSRTIASRRSEHLARIEELKRLLSEVEKKLNNFVQAIADGVPAVVVRDEIQKLSKEKELYTGELDSLTKLSTFSPQPQIEPSEIRKLFEEMLEKKDVRQVRALLKTLISEVVYDKGVFKVLYNKDLFGFALLGSQGRVTGLEPATWGSTVPRSTG